MTFNEIIKSHHLVSKRDTYPVHPHTSLLWYGSLLLVASLFIYLVHTYQQSSRQRVKAKSHIKVLPDYIKALKISDCQEMLEDEMRFRSIGFSTIDEDSLHML